MTEKYYYAVSIIATRQDYRGGVDISMRPTLMRALSYAEAVGLAIECCKADFPSADGWKIGSEGIDKPLLLAQ